MVERNLFKVGLGSSLSKFLKREVRDLILEAPELEGREYPLEPIEKDLVVVEES